MSIEKVEECAMKKNATVGKIHRGTEIRWEERSIICRESRCEAAGET